MEETLFNQKGVPTAYIEFNSAVIYLWNGKPVAYLDGENIYGFNGKHLGWFKQGIVWDEQGKRVGYTRVTLPVYPNYEPYKAYKQYVPYKAYKTYVPYMPYLSMTGSNYPLDFFLMRGAS